MSSVPGEEVNGNSVQEAHLPPIRRLLFQTSSENPDSKLNFNNYYFCSSPWYTPMEVRSLLETLSRRVTEIDRQEQMKFQDACLRTIKHMLQQYNDKIQSTYKRKVARLEERLKSQTDIKEARIMIFDYVSETLGKESDDENEMERKVTELEQKFTELKRKIMDSENEVQSKNLLSFFEKIYEKDTQIKALYENEIEYQRILSEIKEDRDTRLADCHEEITVLNEKLQLLNDEENKQVLTLKNEMKELTEKMTELEEDRDCKIASLKSEIHEQNEVLSDRDSQIAALKMEIEKIASLESEIREQNLVLGDRDRQITVLKTEIEKMSFLESEIRDQNQVLSDRDSQIAALITKIEELVEETNNKDELLEELMTIDDTLKKEKDRFLNVERIKEIVIPRWRTRARAAGYETSGKENQIFVQKAPRDKSKMNCEIIEDSVHKLNVSSSTTEINSITRDPRLRKLVSPVLKPEQLTAGPIKSKVCPEIEEQKMVTEILKTPADTGPRAAAYETSGKENQIFVRKTRRDKSKMNCEIIEDSVHKLNVSSSTTEINSITRDPRLRKLVSPVLKPEQLSAGPIKSKVCPEIEEQKMVTEILKTPEDTRARAAAYETSGKENRIFVRQTSRDKSKMNCEVIKDSLHKFNISSSTTEINSITRDPRLRKLISPVLKPEQLSAGSKKSKVCPEIEEQEIVSVSQDPEESLYLNQPPDDMRVVNMSMSEASEDESASGGKSDRIEWGTSPAKKTKQITRYENSRLPPEILVKIFKNLPLRDKKRAKLVCRFWFDACTEKSFMKCQRFVCCGIYDTASILGTLSNSECTHLNLEFHRVDFFHAFSARWRQLGPRIHALYFVDCMLAKDTLGDVIVNCTEMEHLSFSFKHLRAPPDFKLFPISLFKNLLERRIKRLTLHSMDIQINSSGLFSNSILSNLFAIYPNIRKLSFTCHSLNPVAEGVEAVPPCDINLSDLRSSEALTFSPVLKYVLTPPNSMEKLKLDVHTKGTRTGFGWQLVVSHSKFTRLREIAIEIDLKRLSGNAVIEFCIAQTELKTITCKIVGSANLFISLFLFKLLDNCPRLRNLDVTYKSSFLMSYELYKRLVASKLKSLSIESSNVKLAPQISGELEWPINLHLRSLSLSKGVGNDLKKLFVSIFRNLRFLEIHNPSDELLQLIWKYQISLITLKLVGVEECTIDGFCGLPENMSSFSIRNLQNLEYLLLEVVNNEWQVNGNVFSEFQFPKLRYFCVDMEVSSTLQNDLLEAMQNFTELEGVSITCPGVERSAWLQLNRNWKKLRYLRIVDKESSQFESNQYLKYFTTSPDLRAVSHEFKESTESYYYDILEKTVKRKVHLEKYRITSEKVGNYFIDWLWF